MLPPRPVIGILHPGAMGAAVGAALKPAAGAVIWAAAGRSLTTSKRAETADLVGVPDVAELVRRCRRDHLGLPAGRRAGGGRGGGAAARAAPDQLYVDANAVSPATVTGIAELLGAERVVDGAIIGPPAWEPGRTVVWLAGPAAPAVAALFAGSPFAARVLAGPVGAASALKACFALQSKALPTLWVQLDAAARAYGVADEIREELHRTGVDLDGQLAGIDAQARGKAWRWVGEMQEAADDVRRRGPARRVLPGRGRDLRADGGGRSDRPRRTRGACADRPSARRGPGLPAPVAALDEERRRGLVRVEPGQHGDSPPAARHDHGRHHGGDDGDQRGRAGRRLGDSGAVHVISLAGHAGVVAGSARRSPEGVVPTRLDRVARSAVGDQAQPEGPNRSTRITPSGTPASRRRSVAASANAGEPQTKTSCSARTSGATSSTVMRPRAAGVARRRGAGPHDPDAVAGQLVGVVEVGRAARRDQQPQQVGVPVAAGLAQHRHQRHDARPAADEQRGPVARPHEEHADRPADLQLVARLDDVVQELRDLAVVEPLDGQLDLARAVGRARRPSTSATAV